MLLFLILSLLPLGAYPEPEKKGVVVTVDFDGVVAGNQLTGKNPLTYLNAFGGLVLKNPSMLITAARCHAIIGQLVQEARQKAGPHTTTQSIVQHVLEGFKTQGCGDYLYLKDEITRRSIQPKAIPAMIAFLNELKKEGYTLIGATNQNTNHAWEFMQKLSAQGVPVHTLFDAVLTTHSPEDKELEICPTQAHNFTDLRVAEPDIKKPQEAYYQTLQHIGQAYNPQAKHFLHLDDDAQNVAGANNTNNFNGILIDLPKNEKGKTKNPTSLTPQEQEEVVKKLRTDFEVYLTNLHKKANTENNHSKTILNRLKRAFTQYL